MHIIADFTLIPIGVGVSLSPYVAEVERLLQSRGLKAVLHANGTSVEGEWEAVMDCIRACHERLHDMGVPRIHTDIRLGTRVDRMQKMEDKISSVLEKMK